MRSRVIDTGVTDVFERQVLDLLSRLFGRYRAGCMTAQDLFYISDLHKEPI